MRGEERATNPSARGGEEWRRGWLGAASAGPKYQTSAPGPVALKFGTSAPTRLAQRFAILAPMRLALR